MRITVTERATFRRCRRQWDYNSFNRQGLMRIISKGALATGRLVHASLATWLLQPEQSLRTIFMDHANEELENVKVRYKQAIGAEISEVELGNVYDAIAVGLTTMEAYEAFHKTALPQGYVLVAPEQQLSIPIPGTDHFLEGKLDEGGFCKEKGHPKED